MNDEFNIEDISKKHYEELLKWKFGPFLGCKLCQVKCKYGFTALQIVTEGDTPYIEKILSISQSQDAMTLIKTIDTAISSLIKSSSQSGYSLNNNSSSQDLFDGKLCILTETLNIINANNEADETLINTLILAYRDYLGNKKNGINPLGVK